MKFSINVKDTANPFYQACCQQGQAMGIAIPYLLQAEFPLFKVVATDSGSIVEDSNNKTYRTHFSKGTRFNVAPSFMKGFGREVSEQTMRKSLTNVDFHVFANIVGSSIVCTVVSSKDIASKVTANGEFVLEE